MYIIILHGGGPRRRVDGTEFAFMNNFHCEQKMIYRELIAKFSDLYEMSQESSKQTGSNEQGAFMSRLCMRYEARILGSMARYFKLNGLQIEAYMFDGLMLRIPQEEFMNHYIYTLKGCEIDIMDRTGIPVKLLMKDMTPRPDDMVRLKEPPNRYLERLDVKTYDSSHVHIGTLPWKLGGAKCLAINAQLNMGKTYTILSYVTQVYNRIKTKRLLFITCRRQQARSLQNRTRDLVDETGKKIPIHYYSETTDKDMKLGNGLFIIQYESLYTLGQSFKGFSYVFVDEIRAVMAQICVGMTNKQNLSVNSKIFYALTQSSRWVLTDADIFCDEMVPRFITNTWAPEEVECRNYLYQSLPRTIEIFSSSVNEALFYRLLYSAATSALNDEIPPIGIVCRAKSSLDVIKSTLDNNPRIFWVSSDSPPETLEAFKCINETLEKMKVAVVVFTSCVTVGSDIQANFSQIFMVANSFGGAPARDLWQGIGRFRNVDPSNTVKVLLPSMKKCPSLTPPSFDEVLKEVNDRGEVRHDILRMNSNVVFDRESNEFTFKLTARWLKDVLCCNLLEHEQSNSANFTSSLIRHLVYKGFRLTVATEVDEKEEEDKYKHDTRDKKADLDYEKQLMEIRVRDAILDECDTFGLLCEMVNDLSSKRDKNTATPFQTMKYLVGKCMMKYPEYYKQLSIHDIRFSMSNMTRLYVAKSVESLSSTQHRNAELNSLVKSSIVEEVSLVYTTVKQMDELLARIGTTFSISSDGEYPLDLEKLHSLDTIQSDLENIKSCLKSFSFKKKSKGQKPILVTKFAFGRILHAFGLKLERSRDKRRHLYGIVPCLEFSKLLPHITFSGLDPTRVSRESVKESLLLQEKLYEKFKVVDIQQTVTAPKKDGSRKRRAPNGGGSQVSSNGIVTLILCLTGTP
jgi:hypothetical protein